MAHCAIVGINWGDEGKGRMVDLLTEHYAVLLKTRDLLLEKEKVTGEEFKQLFEQVEMETSSLEEYLD
mgnify:CR=1 FL=1